VPPSSEPDEFELIARHFAPLARSAPGSLGLLDDAAILDIGPGRRLVVTADMAIEGVHFGENDPPGLIGRKVLRYNLSDLAAMGAAPLAYLLTLAKPTARSSDWVGAIADGLRLDQEAFGIALIGGDTTASPGPAVLSITALGVVGAKGGLLRSGARAGDAVFVSGTIGDGALGLLAKKGKIQGLSEADRDCLEGRYQLPEPRLALGQALLGIASAAIDVSDGLVADLGHVCSVSGVGATIEAARVPLSPPAERAVARDEGLWRQALTGGDDYELLFCVPSERVAEIETDSAPGGVAIARIGTISEEAGVRVIAEDGKPLSFERAGYRHF
jgi:thiamine-monophosphate kinase